MQNKKIKIIQILFCTLCILFVLTFGILTVMNNNELSVKEGRKLTTFPKLTFKGLVQDEFYTELTNAFADQLAYRETLIKWYYLFNLQKYVGDVVEGKDGQLFLSPLIIEDETGYEENLKNIAKNDISKVADNVNSLGAKFIFLSVPRKDVAMEKYLPSTYIKGTENYLKYVQIIRKNVSSNVEVMDAYEILKNSDVYDTYYTTDHHINIRGAYPIFETIIDRINEDGHSISVLTLEEEYDVQSVVINGSFNRKIGQSVESKAEELILVPKNTEVLYTREDNGKATTRPIFGEGNTYADAYMGEDIAETVIKTNNNDAPNILYVGSSYTNILEALSVYKFNKMVSIDYRDNKTGKSIEDYVKEHDIDYVVFICSQQNNALSISSIKQHLGLK